jgi:hypothetical protein
MELLSSARHSLSRRTRNQELRVQQLRDRELSKSHKKVNDVRQAWFGCGADVLYAGDKEFERGCELSSSDPVSLMLVAAVRRQPLCASVMPCLLR